VLQQTCQLFIRQRTTLIDSISAHLAEFDIAAGMGRKGSPASLLDVIESNEAHVARPALVQKHMILVQDFNFRLKSTLPKCMIQRVNWRQIGDPSAPASIQRIAT